MASGLIRSGSAPSHSTEHPHAHQLHDFSDRHALANPKNRDALRLALGSILSPKRGSRSHSASGTASPAIYHHGQATPLHAHSHHTAHGHSHLQHSSVYPASEGPSTPLHESECDSQLIPSTQVSAVVIPATSAADTVGVIETTTSISGMSTPHSAHARFVETLQSKSAWDALIHGSFSS